MPDHNHPALLPVHGFVLAGGKSSRMGQDKALLPFCGRPMVEIAVRKLRVFCSEVSIAGNREDLAAYAPVVLESRTDVGPAAGIEAGLHAAKQSWTLFIPVDVPLVPSSLLREWASREIARAGGLAGIAHGSYLVANEERQPAFCTLPSAVADTWTAALSGGQRRLVELLAIAGAGVTDAAQYAESASPSADEMKFWFSNVNTPQELAEAETWALANGSQTFL